MRAGRKPSSLSDCTNDDDDDVDEDDSKASSSSSIRSPSEHNEPMSRSFAVTVRYLTSPAAPRASQPRTQSTTLNSASETAQPVEGRQTASDGGWSVVDLCLVPRSAHSRLMMNNDSSSTVPTGARHVTSSTGQPGDVDSTRSFSSKDPTVELQRIHSIN